MMKILGGMLFLLFSLCVNASEVNQIILIQNSGWMLPFYDDPDSNFKEVVTDLSKRIRKHNSSQTILSFNQSYESNLSPQLQYQGDQPSEIEEAISKISLVKKPGKDKYADTDFKEAIVGAISKYSPGKPAILWVVTNNKNSPNNSSETAQRNKEFYSFLQSSAEIKRIVAFPFPFKVQSKSFPAYKADGLMFYAIAYGDQADKKLLRLVQKNEPFGKQSARLKPQNSEALTFVPKGIDNENVRVSLGNDKKALYLVFDANNKPESATLNGRFRNDFYPYDIKSGDLKIEAIGFDSGDKRDVKINLSDNQITPIGAGQYSKDVKIKITIPSIPTMWDLEVLLKNGYKTNGKIKFDLENQSLVVSKDFIDSMKTLFPNDPLPELFLPSASSTDSVTDQDLTIIVNYPAWPLIVLFFFALLFIAALIYLFSKLTSGKKVKFMVDGYQRQLVLKANSAVDIKNQSGTVVGKLRRGWFGIEVIKAKNTQSNIKIL